MTKFIDVSGDTPKEEKKTVFTHVFNTEIGWDEIDGIESSDYEIVNYLGNCRIDGDIFAAKTQGYIEIFKGTKGDEFNR